MYKTQISDKLEPKRINYRLKYIKYKFINRDLKIQYKKINYKIIFDNI